MKPFCYVTNIWQVLRFLATSPWRVWRRMVLQKLLKMLGNCIIFIGDILPEMLENVPLQVRQRLWFQHDGAPAHFVLDVREYLNNVFPKRRIGRGGPVSDLHVLQISLLWISLSGRDEVFGVRDTDRHSRRAGCPCGRSCSNYSWDTIICTQIPAVH